MKLRGRYDVVRDSLRELGLDPSLEGGLAAPEALASSLRRAAGMYCPASRAALVRVVTEPLRDLVDDPNALTQRAGDVLEAVIAHGDLMELPEVEPPRELRRTLVYASPPAFVERKSGALLLLGIAGEQASLLPRNAELQVEHRAHVRILPAAWAAGIATRLEDLGLIRLSEGAWLERPDHIDSSQLIERLDNVLLTQPEAGQIDGLRVIDPARSAGYYRERWTNGAGVTGRVVGRRPRPYGADFWCYVELADGQPLRFLDLPLAESRYRGCDEAWRLLSALDVANGQAQRLRVRSGSVGTQILDVFSPLPMWLARRWDSVGEPIPHSQGALLSYRINDEDVPEEVAFARAMMWLAVDSET